MRAERSTLRNMPASTAKQHVLRCVGVASFQRGVTSSTSRCCASRCVVRSSRRPPASRRRPPRRCACCSATWRTTTCGDAWRPLSATLSSACRRCSAPTSTRTSVAWRRARRRRTRRSPTALPPRRCLADLAAGRGAPAGRSTTRRRSGRRRSTFPTTTGSCSTSRC